MNKTNLQEQFRAHKPRAIVIAIVAVTMLVNLWRLAFHGGTFVGISVVLNALTIAFLVWGWKMGHGMKPNYWVDFDWGEDNGVSKSQAFEQRLKDYGITFHQDLLRRKKPTISMLVKDKVRIKEVVGIRYGFATKSDFIKARLYS
jgi:hypothetical protein